MRSKWKNFIAVSIHVVRRWENKTDSLFHLRVTFNISMDVKLYFADRHVEHSVTAKFSPSYERVTSCNLTRAARSPTLSQLMYVTSGPSLYSRGIISARRRREVREFVQLRANLRLLLLATVLNKLFNTQSKRLV